MLFDLFVFCCLFELTYAGCSFGKSSIFWNGEIAGLANEIVVGHSEDEACQDPLNYQCCISGTCFCTKDADMCEDAYPVGLFSTLSVNKCSEEGFYYGEVVLNGTGNTINVHSWFSRENSFTDYRGFGSVDMGGVLKLYYFQHTYSNNPLELETYNDPACSHTGNVESNFLSKNFFTGSSVSPNVGISKPPKTKTCSANSTCFPVECGDLGVRCCAADTGTCVCVPHEDAKYCENLDNIVTNTNAFSCQTKEVDGKTVAETFYYGEVVVKGYSKKNPIWSKLYNEKNVFTFRGAGSVVNPGTTVTKFFYFYHYIQKM